MIFLDRRLVGSWYGPVVNVMESTDLVFLADGWGWSRLENAGGALGVTRFRWSCADGGMLRLRRVWTVDGDRARGDADGYRAAPAVDPADEVVETRYRITRQRPYAEDTERDTLLVDEAIDYESTFHRGRGPLPTRADDPSAPYAPYPPTPRPGPRGAAGSAR